ncbi:hypothetical protein GQ44DRAFT_728232 [Phaeosphaeriaceae sp. PMI808]|nr:hypothetical protein GQ44DRAFT_728232 [Phaeosphaeriaceae sp. PMI808]
MAFAPHQPSPLARVISPFQVPRTPPNTPRDTAKLWDECERRAVENAMRRDELLRLSQAQCCSASDLPRTSTKTTSTKRSFDFPLKDRFTASPFTAVAICKICKQPVTYASGICEPCKKNILPSHFGELTPLLSPSARNFASVDLQKLHRTASREEATTPIVTSPKGKSVCPMPTQLLDPPIRLSSLRPPPLEEEAVEMTRTRKVSLTDPNEPFLRLQIAPTVYHPRAFSHSTTPTFPPTPPSTPHSRASTRSSSLGNNTVSPLSTAVHTPAYQYARHTSATPSELSTLYPYTSGAARMNATGYGTQNATSAWDDWDSDEEEKSGLVGLMMGIGKAHRGKKKGRCDSKTNWDGVSAKLSVAREDEKKKSREQKRNSEGKESLAASAVQGRKLKPRAFVRAISCGGCCED